MKSRIFSPLLALLLLLPGAALAADAPPAQPAAADDEMPPDNPPPRPPHAPAPGTTTPAEREAEASPLPREKRPIAGVVVPRYRTVEVDGSFQRAGLYVRPDTALSLDILDLDLRTADGFDAVDLLARDLWSDRYDLMTAIWSPGLPAMARISWDRAVFFNEPLVVAAPAARRSKVLYEGRVRPFPGWLLGASYSTETLSYPVVLREGSLGYNADEVKARVGVPLGKGTLEFRTRDLLFRDRTGYQPSSNTNIYELGYTVPLSRRVALGAEVQWANLNQVGFGNSDLFAARVNGIWQMSSNLRAEARFRYRDMDLGPTWNAYVTRSYGGSTKLSWRPVRPVLLGTGVERSRVERYDAIQTGLERPWETRVWLQADYRGPSSLRAMLRYQFRALDDLPNSSAPSLFNRSALLFDREDRIDLRASATVGGNGLAYGFWDYRRRELGQRQMEHQLHNTGLGVLYPVLRNVTLSGDLFWSMSSTNSGALAFRDTDAVVLHAGVGYQPADRWQLSADFYRAESQYGDDADQDYLSAAVGADLGRGQSLTIGFRKDVYQNSLFPTLGFDADLFNFSYAAGF